MTTIATSPKPSPADPAPPNRADAQDALAAAIARRADLLRAGAQDADIEAADADIRLAERALERAAFQQLAHLDQAEADRKARTESAFTDFYERYKAVSRAFLDALRLAASTRQDVAALIAEGERQFPGRVGAYVAFPGEHIDLSAWMFEVTEREAQAALANERRRAKGEW